MTETRGPGLGLALVLPVADVAGVAGVAAVTGIAANAPRPISVAAQSARRRSPGTARVGSALAGGALKTDEADSGHDQRDDRKREADHTDDGEHEADHADRPGNASDLDEPVGALLACAPTGSSR